ncbi:MAG: nitroreductase family protein [Bacilli bacterium]
MELNEVLAKRVSSRSFNELEIEDNIIEEILLAGEKAPVARGLYDELLFVVIKGDKVKLLRNRLISLMGKDPFYKANCLILLASKGNKDYLNYANAGAIIENMHLKATELNLGSLYIYGATPFINDDNNIRKMLCLDPEYKSIAILALGHSEVELIGKKHTIARKTLL